MLSAGTMLVLAITSFALRRPSNVYIIDHLNINHEQGRHDLLTAFYVERLVLAAGDTRADGAPRQTLTFASGARESMSHAELGSDENGKPVNNGAHFSLSTSPTCARRTLRRRHSACATSTTTSSGARSPARCSPRPIRAVR